MNNDGNYKFSIILANYNGEKYISQAIESVLNQTFQGWELLVVDDGSTDSSVNIIEEYMKRFNTEQFNINNNNIIKLIKLGSNYGLASALDIGINNISSEFFGLLDGDDILSNNAVEIMYNAHIENPDCSLIYSQFMICDIDLKPLKKGYCREIPEGKTNLESDKVSHFKTGKRDFYFKTSRLDIDLKSAIDKDLIFKMEEVGNLKFIDKILYYYRQRPDSLSRGKNREIARKNFEKVKEEAKRRRKGLQQLK